ncbi:helix-turn-helix domain-containing protein [Mycolicibacterium sp. XJ775]
MTDTPWLNQKEASEYAKQSVDSIRAAVKAGDLVAYAIGKSGRDFRLNREDIDAWMRSRTWEPVA